MLHEPSVAKHGRFRLRHRCRVAGLGQEVAHLVGSANVNAGLKIVGEREWPVRGIALAVSHESNPIR